MAENRPGPADRKLVLIAPLAIGIVVAALLIANGLHRKPPPSPPAAPATVAPAPPKPPPAAPKPLGRADLIAAANQAASAYSDGGTTGSRPDLIGQRFAIEIPFGCDGPQTAPGPAQAFFEYDGARRTLKLVARPAEWLSLPIVQDLRPAGSFEAVEGFWIPRPWGASEACPNRRIDPLPATPTPPASPTLGLAQVYPIGAARNAQRGDRPYEYLLKAGEDEVTPLTRTFRLGLEGRIVGFDRASALTCWSESAAHRPICLYGVQFDRIAFKDGADGSVLAEWRN